MSNSCLAEYDAIYREQANSTDDDCNCYNNNGCYYSQFFCERCKIFKRGNPLSSCGNPDYKEKSVFIPGKYRTLLITLAVILLILVCFALICYIHHYIKKRKQKKLNFQNTKKNEQENPKSQNGINDEPKDPKSQNNNACLRTTDCISDCAFICCFPL